MPILPPDLPPPSESKISARLHQDGLWGFTGNESPPPSPSTLPESLGALSEWGITMEKLVRSPRGTDEEEREVRKYGEEIEKFVKRRWDPREWETAWFVNPPVSAFHDTVPIECLIVITEAAERAGADPHTRLCAKEDTHGDRSSRDQLTDLENYGLCRDITDSLVLILTRDLPSRGYNAS